jgi:undecaprenyl-diphosphatase
MVMAILSLSTLLILKNRKKAAVVSLVTLIGSVVFIYFFKVFFGRVRPNGCLNSGDCLSFPSGHTALSVYFYGLLIYLVWRFFPISLKKFLIISLTILFLVVLIGLSRIVLQVHYPSDILAGTFLGGSFLLLAIWLIDLLYR